MTLTDWLSQFGASAATLGGAARFLLYRFRIAETNAEEALKIAKDVQLSVTALQQGLRIEITHFKTELVQRVQQTTRGSRPDFDSPRIEELARKIAEVRGGLLREQSARHAFQREIQEDAKEEALQWTELNRELATLAARVEILMERTTERKR